MPNFTRPEKNHFLEVIGSLFKFSLSSGPRREEVGAKVTTEMIIFFYLGAVQVLCDQSSSFSLMGMGVQKEAKCAHSSIIIQSKRGKGSQKITFAHKGGEQ